MRKLVTNVRRVIATVGVEILLLAGIGVMDVSAQNSDTCTCDDVSCTCITQGSDWQAGSWIDDADAVASDPFADDGITVSGS